LLSIDFKNASCADFLAAIAAWIVVSISLYSILVLYSDMAQRAEAHESLLRNLVFVFPDYKFSD
jgi:hypothetical protein